MRTTRVAASLAVCLCLSMIASAAPLVEETFDYPAGPLDGANGGTGFTGPWIGSGTYEGAPWQMNVVDSPVVAYEGYDTLGRTVPCTTSTAWDDSFPYNAWAERPVTPISTANGSVLWLGVSYYHSHIYAGGGLVGLVDSADPSKSMALETYRGLDAEVIGPDGQPTGETRNAVHFRVKLGTSPGQTVPFSYQSHNAMGLETSYFLLAKFEFTADYTLALMNYYQTPEALPTTEPTVWDAWVSVPAEWNLNIDSLRLLMARSNRGNNLGEVRIGAGMSDVMLVPEPASLALLGLGGLAMLRRKR